MNYRGFEISKKPYILKPHRKMWSFYYGRGNAKNTAYFETKNECKAFIDWIIESDYATIYNDMTLKLRWKYLDLTKTYG